MKLIEIILKWPTKKRSEKEFYKFWQMLNITVVELHVGDSILLWQ